MQSIVKKVLDTVRPYKGAPIHVVHGDYNSRFINAVICTNGIPNNATASEAVTVTYEREDGQSRTFSGSYNDDGSVTVPIPQWAMEEDGYITAWITVSTAESSLSTMEFMIEAHERSNVNGEISEDDPEYNDILSILARIADHDVRINETAKLAQSATENAERNDKRITNLEKRLDDSLFVTDDSVSYAKIVPSDALPYAEISKIGGMSHPDAKTNTLKEAKVTAIKSIGVNMANIQDRTETVKNSYYIDTPLGIRLDLNSKYTISMDYEVVSTDAPTLSLGVGYGENAFHAGIFDKSYPNMTSGTLVVTITTPTKWLHSNKAWVRLVRGATPHNSTVKISNFMFVKGDTLPSAFVPYEESILSIPPDIQSLDGYGCGVNGSYCNYINWQPGNFIKTWNKLVKKQIFNKIQGFYSCLGGNSTKHYVKLGTIEKGDLLLPHTNDHVYALISNRYDATIAYNTARGLGGNSISVEASQNAPGTGSILVYDETLQTEAEWNAKLAIEPIEVVYVINPVITDISELLSDDNYIEVYEGGSVIAENDSGLAAPTTTTYQIKEAAE